jgi:hypothetical protein
MKRVLHKLFAFLITPVLGYLIGATIFNHFWDKPETDLSGASHIITARSCERHGPVALRGFGYWYECRATVENKMNGNVVTATARGFLNPDLIGKPVAGDGFRRGELFPERPYAGWGMVLLLPFGVLWLYVYIRVAWPLLPERRKSRRRPVGYQRPDLAAASSRAVQVPAGRPRVWLFFVFLLGGFGAIRFTSSAFQGDAVDTAVTVVSWAVLVLVVGTVGWRLLLGAAITISPDGLGWHRKNLGWAEIQEVRLTRRNVLVIRPRVGEVERIGRFSAEQATRVHVAMGHFSQASYTRERDSLPAEERQGG